MSSSQSRNSWTSKIADFLRGVIVFLFLISIPTVALYWDHMPFGVKAGFQWVRTQMSHSDSSVFSAADFSGEKSDSEPVFGVQNEGIFPETELHQEFLPGKTVSIFPIQQVSHNQPRQTPVPVSQPSLTQFEASGEQTVMQNSEIPDLEREMRLLGASQCRLEPWGNEGQLYRFSCFAVPSSGPYGFQKHFQQIAPTPEEAMKKVREQLLDWQSRERQN